MWVVMSARHAERGMADQERENNSETQRETDRGRPSKSCLSAVHSSPTHCKYRETESGKSRLPIKNRERKKRRGEGEDWEKPMPALSLGPPRGNDQTLSLTSAADGHQGPSTLICLLFCYNTFHLSPPFLCSPCSPPPQAVPVIGYPTVLDLVPRVCISVSVCLHVYDSQTLCDCMCMFLHLIV